MNLKTVFIYFLSIMQSKYASQIQVIFSLRA